MFANVTDYINTAQFLLTGLGSKHREIKNSQFFWSKTNCAMMSKEDDGMGESILISVRLWVKTRVICQWRYLANYRIVLLWTIKIFFQLFLSNRILLTLWGFCMIYFCHFLFPASHSISFQTHLLHTTSTHLEADFGFLATAGFSLPSEIFPEPLV